MNKIVYAFAAFAALSGPAHAADFDRAERDAWRATVLNPSFEAAPVITEGRNAAMTAPSLGGVEPYIAQSLEQNARSSR